MALSLKTADDGPAWAVLAFSLRIRPTAIEGQAADREDDSTASECSAPFARREYTNHPHARAQREDRKLTAQADSSCPDATAVGWASQICFPLALTGSRWPPRSQTLPSSRSAACAERSKGQTTGHGSPFYRRHMAQIA